MRCLLCVSSPRDLHTQGSALTHHQSLAHLPDGRCLRSRCVSSSSVITDPEANKNNVLARACSEHKEAIISHLSWVTPFPRFPTHPGPLRPQRVVPLAFGYPETAILVEPVFAPVRSKPPVASCSTAWIVFPVDADRHSLHAWNYYGAVLAAWTPGWKRSTREPLDCDSCRSGPWLTSFSPRHRPWGGGPFWATHHLIDHESRSTRRRTSAPGLPSLMPDK